MTLFYFENVLITEFSFWESVQMSNLPLSCTLNKNKWITVYREVILTLHSIIYKSHLWYKQA